jgi:hypothetical protein
VDQPRRDHRNGIAPRICQVDRDRRALIPPSRKVCRATKQASMRAGRPQSLQYRYAITLIGQSLLSAGAGMPRCIARRNARTSILAAARRHY